MKLEEIETKYVNQKQTGLPGRSSAARTSEEPTAPNTDGSYATRAKLWTGWRKTTCRKVTRLNNIPQ